MTRSGTAQLAKFFAVAWRATLTGAASQQCRLERCHSRRWVSLGAQVLADAFVPVGNGRVHLDPEGHVSPWLIQGHAPAEMLRAILWNRHRDRPASVSKWDQGARNLGMIGRMVNPDKLNPERHGTKYMSPAQPTKGDDFGERRLPPPGHAKGANPIKA
jgi:hypothetical protein